MPTWRVALGMALGSGLVGLSLGWAARPADAGWYGAGLTGQSTDCAALVPTLALAEQLLSPSAAAGPPPLQEWWLRTTETGAVVEVVTDSGGHRLRLQQEEATGRWRPAACAVVSP